MKKKNLKSLKLNKKSISKLISLKSLKGGKIQATSYAGSYCMNQPCCE